MATEMTFIVQYGCPRCDAALEARSSQTYGWLRCPRCGCASLPPEHMRTPRTRTPVPIAPGEEILIIGPERSREAAPDRASFRPGSFRRIAAATGLFLSLLIALLSLVEHDRVVAMVFALVALACLAVSVYPARPRVA
jgi:DNA-directed RNA polymerase subunit RPC12/RpoP